MSITTGRGKDGQTDLLFGRRIEKHDLRIEVCGSIDELNAYIGVVRASGISEEAIALLDAIQKHLVAMMGEVARLHEDAVKYDEKGYSKITAKESEWLNVQIKEIESGGVTFRGWARPGEAIVQAGAFLDVCRTICRRAERQFWNWDREDHYLIHKRYLNNLSDLLWLLARDAEK